MTLHSSRTSSRRGLYSALTFVFLCLFLAVGTSEEFGMEASEDVEDGADSVQMEAQPSLSSAASGSETESDNTVDNTDGTEIAAATLQVNSVSSNSDLGLHVNKIAALTDVQRYQFLQNPWRPPVGFEFPYVVHKNQRRYFNAQWLNRYSWLSFSNVLQGALCRVCVLFAPEFAGKGGHQRVEQFVNKPCTNWKDFHELCSLHIHCKYHETAVELASNFEKMFRNPKGDIAHLLDQSLAEQESKARKALLPIVKTVLFCGRQGLALRGHNERSNIVTHSGHNDGNFRALLRFRIDAGDADLQHHLETASKNAQYTSPSIQNELIVCAGKLITDEIAARVNAAKSFAILADETTDSSCKEQLSVCVRYVHYDAYGHPQLREDFVGFVDVSSDLTAAGLSTAILNTVQSVGIDISYCHGQGYDGASAMSGRLHGVQAIIMQLYPLALYTHCASHCLNLALGKACTVPVIRNMLGVVSELLNFFSHSAQRSRLLEETVEKLQEDDVIPASRRKRLTHLCETRWVERHESLLALVELFPAVLRCLETMQVEGNASTSRNASLLLNSLKNCANIVGLAVAQHISSLLLPLTTQLQSKSLDLIACCAEVDAVVVVLRQYRESADAFADIHSKASALCDVAGTEITVPRVTGRQRHRANIAPEVQQEGGNQQTPQELYFRVNVFNPFVDYLLTELHDRFVCHKSNAFALQCLVPKFSQKASLADIQPAIRMYENVLEGTASDVEAEFALWRTKCVNGTVCADNAFDALENCPSVYPNIKFLLQILTTLPVTTASAERTFSMLRRLKTWLRSSMCDERLTGLALLTSTDIEVKPEDVINSFLQPGKRRIA